MYSTWVVWPSVKAAHIEKATKKNRRAENHIRINKQWLHEYTRISVSRRRFYCCAFYFFFCAMFYCLGRQKNTRQRFLFHHVTDLHRHFFFMLCYRMRGIQFGREVSWVQVQVERENVYLIFPIWKEKSCQHLLHV